MNKSLTSKITLSNYNSLIARCIVIERDAYGEKVLIAPDGNYVKIFRTKSVYRRRLSAPMPCVFVKMRKRLPVWAFPRCRFVPSPIVPRIADIW